MTEFKNANITKRRCWHVLSNLLPHQVKSWCRSSTKVLGAQGISCSWREPCLFDEQPHQKGLGIAILSKLGWGTLSELGWGTLSELWWGMLSELEDGQAQWARMGHAQWAGAVASFLPPPGWLYLSCTSLPTLYNLPYQILHWVQLGHQMKRPSKQNKIHQKNPKSLMKTALWYFPLLKHLLIDTSRSNKPRRQ